MKCPYCKKTDTSVVDSRDLDEATIRRRRECENCHQRFTTYERLEPVKLSVVKKNGQEEPYVREKLIKGIQLSVEKRGISSEKIDLIVDEIEKDIFVLSQGGPVPTTKIGQLVLKKLKDLDEVAYLRFSSVYKDFKSLKSFEKELLRLGRDK